jgi:hypothetical protein
MNTDGFGVAARVSRASGTGLGLFAPPAQIRAAVSAFLDRARGVPGLAVEAALPDFATPALGRELAKLGLVALLPRKSWISDDFARRPEGTGTAKSTLDDFARRPEGTGTAKSMLNDFARRPEGSGTAKSMLNDFTKGATPRALRRALRDGCILHLSTTRYSPASSAADAMDALVALAAEKQLPFVTLRSWTRETKD